MKYQGFLLVAVLIFGIAACIPPVATKQIAESARPPTLLIDKHQAFARFNAKAYAERKERARLAIERARQEAQQQAPQAVQPSVTSHAHAHVQALEKPEYAAIQSRPTSVMVATCSDGQAEIEKARGALENSDKLFHYRRALRVCPGEAAFHKALGDFYLSINRADDAQFEFDEAQKFESAGDNKSSVPEELKY